MKFERLTSSIALNSNESPSIYMAMCMIESLFRDLEDATGKEISRIAPGDETLPTKLIWLARTLLKIYSENADEMQRNRKRLDVKMDELREKQEALSALSKVADELREANDRAQILSRQLNEAEQSKREAMHIMDLCREKRARIEELQKIDPARTRAELSELTEREKELSAERETLANDLAAGRQKTEALKSECSALKTELDTIHTELETFADRKQTLTDDIARHAEAIEACRATLSDLTQEKDKAITECAFFQTQAAQLRQEIEERTEREIAPLKQETEALEQQHSELQEQLSRLKKENDSVLMTVALLGQQIIKSSQELELRQQALAQKQTEADAAAAELDRINEQISGKTEELAQMQQQGEDLLKNKLPEIRTYIEEQTRQNALLAKKKADLEERKNALCEALERLKDSDAQLQAELEVLNRDHAELTASYEANNDELIRLRQKVDELQGKNGREKQRTYLKQLTAEREELEAVEAECADLEQQIRATAESRKKKAEERRNLLETKGFEEQAEKQIAAAVQQLKPYASQEMLKKIDRLQSRLQFLQTAGSNLNEAVGMMLSVTGRSPSTINPQELSSALDQYQKNVDQLQKELLKCADSIKLEES